MDSLSSGISEAFHLIVTLDPDMLEIIFFVAESDDFCRYYCRVYRLAVGGLAGCKKVSAATDFHFGFECPDGAAPCCGRAFRVPFVVAFWPLWGAEFTVYTHGHDHYPAYCLDRASIHP